ncbi:transglycosylase domain-containing protein [Nitratireductor aquimarinus]|uniref:transglycosylase domain-containing protein n=1 Tax=Nitratireductor aquimarinus TaxID=889300 RepID=UPI001A903CC2|nr:transglycosylase domain-containing protein [Nitratireductor aquimarinus]MBN8241532.1 transglycosylase domain-containing protein [Nitratireductor aquimarinus]MBY6129918.1 transglycosylase domain-containing protein [Nitratireductor aquimarinus]MCA1304045.1 transglycosylase domain-containing protein [Nitratireductor aquimarinus]
MKKILKTATTLILAIFAAALAYGGWGYLYAIKDADALKLRADALIAENRGGQSLGDARLQQLLQVQDPNFQGHSGVDMITPGAGVTTITQSAAKRLAFEAFKPGIGKIRQTGYALGLESELTKEQILALWLDTLEMGKGPDGWVTGFHRASEKVFGKAPSDLQETEFLSLVAVLIAPGKYRLGTDDPALAERVERIARLVSGSCSPLDNGDVWLEGCR